jgi:hypothetical protein
MVVVKGKADDAIGGVGWQGCADFVDLIGVELGCGP